VVDELEWQTCRDRINKRLQSLNPPWSIVKYTDELGPATLARHALEEYPTASGPADYALFVNGRLLGIIEAKKSQGRPSECPGAGQTVCKGRF